MPRLSRAETQERNRAKVLAAARDEFTERGFRDAKIDVIAERAELTRGAVYSNFPGKRALYFAVLADAVGRDLPPPSPGDTPSSCVGSFAASWLSAGGLDLPAEVVEPVRRPYTQLLHLDALLLALALEHWQAPGSSPIPRLVRLATTILTTLHGASRLAPAFVEPFDVVSACEQLSKLTLNDYWAPPSPVPPVRPESSPWSPPAAVDLVTGAPARLATDGVVAILGLNRASAAEELIRGAGSGTVVLVTSDPAELTPLTHLLVSSVTAYLRRSFPFEAWPRLQIVCDAGGTVAAAAGVAAVSDETEAAIRVESGMVTARADGPAATTGLAAAVRPSRPRYLRTT